MSEQKKPALTRKLKRQYARLLACASNYSDVSQYWAPRRFDYTEWTRHGHVGYAAYCFAKRWGSRDIDLKRLQSIILRFGNAETLYLFGRDLPWANKRRITRALIERADGKWMRLFAQLEGVHPADANFLVGIANIAEVISF